MIKGLCTFNSKLPIKHCNGEHMHNHLSINILLKIEAAANSLHSYSTFEFLSLGVIEACGAVAMDHPFGFVDHTAKWTN